MFTFTALQVATLSAGIVFSPQNILRWPEHVFTKPSSYTVIATGETQLLDAQCKPGEASGLFFREGVNLQETPWIRWQWRVLQTPSGADEQTRSGDDFALRIYAIDEHRVLRWRTRALNYVWAKDADINDHWPNPFAQQAHMIALQSGVVEPHTWRVEVRNLQEDFIEFHGRNLDELSALAIMTDCDNTQSTAHGQLLEISFHAEKPQG
ncbi:DUF3047 domain-containing protein [Aliidiomarina sp.]|uniref:DUF3047 domain-containing protein n=1 Tax=Aliidiomarina sp. TaxID=1872439 RepID=UPI003A4DC077